MNMIPVSSSNISSIGYQNRTLYVSFHSGGLYAYSGVPEAVYRELMSASSHGKYLPYFGYSTEKQLALAYIQFDNLSNSAVSITDVSIVINEIAYPCDKLPTTVASSERKIGRKIVSSSSLYNMSLPVCLSGYGGSSGYFVFQIPLESAPPASTRQMLLISTNRGSSFQAELKPEQESFC